MNQARELSVPAFLCKQIEVSCLRETRHEATRRPDATNQGKLAQNVS